jgi:hypothetical protein
VHDEHHFGSGLQMPRIEIEPSDAWARSLFRDALSTLLKESSRGRTDECSAEELRACCVARDRDGGVRKLALPGGSGGGEALFSWRAVFLDVGSAVASVSRRWNERSFAVWVASREESLLYAHSTFEAAKGGKYASVLTCAAFASWMDGALDQTKRLQGSRRVEWPAAGWNHDEFVAFVGRSDAAAAAAAASAIRLMAVTTAAPGISAFAAQLVAHGIVASEPSLGSPMMMELL